MDEDPKAAKRKDLRKVRREAAGYSKEIALLKKQLAIHKRKTEKTLAAFGERRKGGKSKMSREDAKEWARYRADKAAEAREDKRQAAALGSPHEILRNMAKISKEGAAKSPATQDKSEALLAKYDAALKQPVASVEHKEQPPPLPKAKLQPPPLPPKAKPMFARSKSKQAKSVDAAAKSKEEVKPLFQSRVKSAFKAPPLKAEPSKIPQNTPIHAQPMSREDIAHAAGLKRQVIGGDHAPAPHVPAPREGLAHRAGAATGNAVRKTSQAVGKAVQSVKQAPAHLAQKASGAVKSLASGAMSKILRAKSALGFKPKLAKEDPRFAVETGLRGGRFYMNNQGTKVYIK